MKIENMLTMEAMEALIQAEMKELMEFHGTPEEVQEAARIIFEWYTPPAPLEDQI